MRKDERGFTLIELMIVVAVIAVLSAIAYPSYQEYVMRSRRAEAQSLLNEAAARQERWRAQNGSYITPGGAETDITKLKLPNGTQSEHGYYTLEVANDASGYLLTARRAGSQAADGKCGNFTLNAAGKKDMVAGTPGTVEQCWR
ncbi:type IV pilin protein [Variovorax sp. LT1P1]|uniref:type IV pilin protein n=1 Tax=Variovorax sp. LT1P1 TaxID=3443730 RepID=UPI003F44C0F7